MGVLVSGVYHVYAQNGGWRGFGYALRCGREDNVAAKANQLANFPLNFLRTGYYYYSDGKVYNRMVDGDWWTATGSSATFANRLGTNVSYVRPHLSNDRGSGFAVRYINLLMLGIFF